MGSSLSEALVEAGWQVTIFDNLSSGSKKNLSQIGQGLEEDNPELIIGDCTQPGSINHAIRECDAVFHFAANPEVRMELNNPDQCFRQNVYATHNVLEAFRPSRAQTFVFASTSTVYGDAKTFPTPENYSPLEPISVYGASKLAGEALVSSYCHAFRKRGIILRFANVVGPRSKHGVVGEFVARLDSSPYELPILGDGTQNKSYIYVDDCVNAVLATVNQANRPLDVFNVGSEDRISVREIGSTVAKTMGLHDPQFTFNGGLDDGRGWIGDVKTMLLDVNKLKSIGWSANLNSQAAVELTVKQILHRRKVRTPS